MPCYCQRVSDLEFVAGGARGRGRRDNLSCSFSLLAGNACYCQFLKPFLVQAVRAAVVAALPPGVGFVTPAWVPACLQRGELLPAGHHRIALVLLVLAERQDGAAAASAGKSPSPSPAAAGLRSAGAGAGSAAGSVQGSPKGSTDAHAAPGSGRVAAPAAASAPPSKDAADTQGDEVREPR